MTGARARERDWLSPQQAFRDYELAPRPTDDISDIERSLRDNGIAPVRIPISPSEFAALSDAYEVCIEECPDELADTATRLDMRFGSEIGQARKECSIRDGVQVSDPKNLFHFSEIMRTPEWQERHAGSPASLSEFLKMGIEMHDLLLREVAMRAIGELEQGSYSNLSRLYLPSGEGGEPQTRSFLRVIRYDSYEPYDRNGALLKLGEVAKRHFDAGGITIQAYADAGGLLGKPWRQFGTA
jgi:hypothetical protein